MKTVSLDYNEIHELVDSTPGAFWDGWTAVFFRPDNPRFKSGERRPDGLRRIGRWGTAKRVAVDNSGNWSVPQSVVSARPRN